MSLLYVYAGIVVAAFLIATYDRFPPYRKWRRRRDERIILRSGHGPLLTARVRHSPACGCGEPFDGEPLSPEDLQRWMFIANLRDLEMPDAVYPAPPTHETPHAEDETK